MCSTFDAVTDCSDSNLEALASANGPHSVRWGDGSTSRMAVDGVPAPLMVAGEWRLTFPGTDEPLKLPELTSWTDMKEFRHFSGTARYEIAFDLPGSYTADGIELELDLGRVGAVAEIWLNDQAVGTRWMRSQTFAIAALARPGRNALRVDVTNTLINRVSGWEDIPPVPAELRERYGDGLEHRASISREVFEYEALPPSGLLGPVIIRPAKRVRIGRESGR